ncbi:MAG: putative quinol monooxygenase [Sphingomonadales bacterium]
MIGIVAKLKVKPGKGPDFETHMTAMTDQVERNEVGNLFYRGHRMAPDTFLVLELYRDREAVDAHGKSAHVADALPRVGAMLDGDVEVEMLEQVW